MKSVVLIATGTLLLLSSCRAADENRQIKLPHPGLEGILVEEAIARRRSVRSYSDESLGLEELSQILFAAQGITARRGEVGLRTAPSAGATYPIEIYVLVNRVATLEPGIYHYRSEGHMIDLLRPGAFGDDLSAACLGQSMPREAAVSLVMTAVPHRTTGRYGTRGIMYVHMEAGHISQNVCLECTSLGLGAVPIGAFDAEDVNRLIGVDGESEMALYINSIGKLEQTRGESD